MQTDISLSETSAKSKAERTSPAESASFKLEHGDELIATVPWPKWPGAILLGTPLLIAGYAFGFRGTTLDAFLSDSGRFVNLMVELTAAHYALGVALLLVTTGLAAGLYGSIASLINTSRIYIAQSNLIVKTTPLPFFRRYKRFALSDVISVSAKKHGDLDGRRQLGDFLLDKHYALFVRLRDQGPVGVLWNLGGKDQALSVARAINARIDAYNTPRQPDDNDVSSERA